MGVKRFLTYFLLLIIVKPIDGQVYNYNPVSYSNIETNLEKSTTTLFQKEWSLGVLYNFHLDPTKFNTQKYSTVQISLTFKL